MLYFPMTELDETRMWQAAAVHYGDHRRAYHTMDGHLRGMYRWWERFGWDYCPKLDAGVLAHDVILDGQGRHEERSAMWYSAVSGDAMDTDVPQMILSTASHVPQGGWGVGDPRLIVLDLADFLDEATTRANSDRIVKEAQRFDITRSERDILQTSTAYLRGLATRLEAGVPAAPSMPIGPIQDGVIATIYRLENGII